MKTLTPQSSAIATHSPRATVLPPQFTAHPAHPVTVWLDGVRAWLAAIEIRDAAAARAVCQVIPAFCPFAQEIKLGNRTLLTIPPLCQFNPFYEQLVTLRFKALTYLEVNATTDPSDR
jgi:Mo-dependent nitrogenase C-terminus